MLADAASPLLAAPVAVGRAFASTECGRDCGIAFCGSFGGGIAWILCGGSRLAWRCGGGTGGNGQGAAVAATDAVAAGAAGGGAPAAFDATETVGPGSGQVPLVQRNPLVLPLVALQAAVLAELAVNGSELGVRPSCCKMEPLTFHPSQRCAPHRNPVVVR